MESKSGLYTIDNFTTQLGPGQKTFGPSITLDGDVVKAVIQTLGNRAEYERLFTNVSHYLTRAVGNNLARLDFFEDTCFLQGIVVGRNCACFTVGNGIHGIRSESYRNVRYTAHNIDHAAQSVTLVTTWLMWLNIVINETEFELPYAL